MYSYTEDTIGNVVQTDVTNPYVTRYVFNTVGYNSGGSLVAKTKGYWTGIAQTMTYERNATTKFVTAGVDALGRRIYAITLVRSRGASNAGS